MGPVVMDTIVTRGYKTRTKILPKEITKRQCPLQLKNKI